jgi:glycerol-3-phosphate acyltransferase PlsY
MAGDGRLVSDYLPLLVALIGGYLLGSIPFGLVLTRVAGFGDIRTIGSGNIGATNVLRTGNKPLAIAVMLLDAGKGALAVLITASISEDAALTAAVGAILGHLFPVWLGFKGGKGVATTLGAFWALAWPVGAIACAVWLAMALVFRISSLAALTAILAAPLLTAWFNGPEMAAAVFGIAVLVWIKHTPNIKRLLAGTEPRISLGGKTSA